MWLRYKMKIIFTTTFLTNIPPADMYIVINGLKHFWGIPTTKYAEIFNQLSHRPPISSNKYQKSGLAMTSKIVINALF